MIELLAIFAVWRISSLLTRPRDSGPWEMFAKLRDITGIRYDERGYCLHPALNPLCCLWCTSIWVALPVAIYVTNRENYGIVEVLIFWFAFSAGAILIESVVER